MTQRSNYACCSVAAYSHAQYLIEMAAALVYRIFQDGRDRWSWNGIDPGPETVPNGVS
jgi:hypothetical protein